MTITVATDSEGIDIRQRQEVASTSAPPEYLFRPTSEPFRNAHDIVAVSYADNEEIAHAMPASNQVEQQQEIFHSSKSRCKIFLVLISIVMGVSVAVGINLRTSKNIMTQPTYTSDAPDYSEGPSDEIASLARKVWNDNLVGGSHYWSTPIAYDAGPFQCIDHPGLTPVGYSESKSYTAMAETMTQVFQDARLTVQLEYNIRIAPRWPPEEPEFEDCTRMQDFCFDVLEMSPLVPSDVAKNLTQARMKWRNEHDI